MAWSSDSTERAVPAFPAHKAAAQAKDQFQQLRAPLWHPPDAAASSGLDKSNMCTRQFLLPTEGLLDRARRPAL